MADPVRSTADEDEPDRPDGVAEPNPSESEAGSDGSGSSGKQRKKTPLWREVLILVATALVLTFLIQTFLARVYVIPSGSMEQTLHGCTGCSDDRVLVDKVTYDFRDPSPGDVVVFRGPDTWGEKEFQSNRSDNPVVNALQSVAALVGLAPPDERDFVKRVIAVGGQTVQCCDAQHRVLVDGKPLDEPYVYWQPGTGPGDNIQFAPVTVPKGSLWVMGDNRMNSCDSRCQGGGGERGVVPIDHVIGKARFIVLPPSRWQGIGDHDPQAVSHSLGVPPWESGLPAGAGFAVAFPAVWFGRRLWRGFARRRAN